ncbi:MAG: S9 family peptidase [Candidatus Acidiferrales bacterium]
MDFVKRFMGCGFAVFMLALVCAAQSPKRAIQFDDLIAMHRISDPQISPDGKWIAYVVSTPDMAANHSVSNIWLVPATGGDERQITRGGSDYRPRWSPDGQRIAFISSRDGASQVYTMSNYGGEASRLTFVSTGADNEVWSPDGKWMAFISRVYPDCRDDACNKARDEAAEKDKVKAHIAERLLYRHWTDWGPAYSPDGKWIAYRAQMTPGYESDRWQLMIYNRATGEHVDLTPNFDFNVDSYIWSSDSRVIYFPAEYHAEMPIFGVTVSAGAAPDNTPKRVIPEGFNGEITLSGDGKRLAFSRSSLTYPEEVFSANADGTDIRQITHQNGALLAPLDLPPADPFWFDGANGTKVEGLLIKPPHFDASQKYPMLLLVHGGPQGAWDDDWGYRWNPEVMAAPGYVVVMINPRGSTGYGQKFTDEIQDDWGGKPYVDLMDGVDYVLAHNSYIDSTRLGEAGGSYGGYMTDWIATHTGRFRCFISHAGPYDLVSMYGATEELWFVEHDLKGTPWTNPASYAKWSPSTYAEQLGKFHTPMLVIDGELDFRVPYTQDLEIFTALQRQGVPSKLIIFPDEGHWVLKPQNSKLWYREFLGWLATYLK